MKQLDQEKLKSSFEKLYLTKVKEIRQLKRNHIFLLETSEEPYIVKLFHEESSIHWQERFLYQMIEKNVSGMVPFLKNSLQKSINVITDPPMFYAVMPFIPGESIDPQNFSQVRDGFKLLSHFHHHGSGIYGKQQVIPFRSHFFEKWKDRLELFDTSMTSLESIVKEHDGVHSIVKKYASEVMDWAKWSLNHFPHPYMLYLEEQAQWERQVAHLDVAPHNFLVLEHQYYYLIDYDLVNYAPPLIDVVQFLNRMLYHYEWSFDAMYEWLNEYTYTNPLPPMQLKILPILLIYPNDFLREWLGIWKNQAGYHPSKAYQYFYQLDQTWSKRRKFVHACMAMVK
jgi:Ser/Thr protein kinase RdoA (MazF antagonist)